MSLGKRQCRVWCGRACAVWPRAAATRAQWRWAGGWPAGARARPARPRCPTRSGTRRAQWHSACATRSPSTANRTCTAGEARTTGSVKCHLTSIKNLIQILLRIKLIILKIKIIKQISFNIGIISRNGI